MTEKLRNLLHDRATRVDFSTPDLDSLVRAGDRRRRRRTGALAGGVAALAVAGALVVPALSGDDPEGPATHATSTLPVDELSWVTGSVIHAGDEAVDVGVPVAAYVATVSGYAFAGTDGTIYALVDGEVSEIGHTDGDAARLVTDHGSSLVGWVSTQGGVPAFVVHDLATGSRVLEDGSTVGRRPYFYALDGDTAYWRDEHGAVAVDVTTREVEVLQDDAGGDFDLIDVQDGVIALTRNGQGITVGTSADDAHRLPGVFASTGVLSPGATAFAPDAEELTVLGVSDGRDLTPTLSGYYFSTVYEWADDDTVRVTALEEEGGSFDLLSCTISTGECELVVEGAGREDGLQLPVGVPLGG